MNDISEDLRSQPYICRFGDTVHEYIQVPIDEFVMTGQVTYQSNFENLLAYIEKTIPRITKNRKLKS